MDHGATTTSNGLIIILVIDDVTMPYASNREPSIVGGGASVRLTKTGARDHGLIANPTPNPPHPVVYNAVT